MQEDQLSISVSYHFKLKPFQIKKGQKNLPGAQFLVSFSQLPAVKKDTENCVPRTFFVPSYFVTTLVRPNKPAQPVQPDPKLTRILDHEDQPDFGPFLRLTRPNPTRVSTLRAQANRNEPRNWVNSIGLAQ